MWGRRQQRNKFTTISRPKQRLGPLRRKIKLISWLILFLFIVWLYFFVISDIFDLKQVKIKGTKNISQFELEKIVWEQARQKQLWLIPQNKLLFFSKIELRNQLDNNFQLEELFIKKQWPNTLVINLKEKDYAWAWLENDIYYYINESGDIILETAERPIGQIIVIANMGQTKKGERRVEIDSRYLQAIAKIQQAIHSLGGAGLVVQQYIVDDELNTVKLKIEEGPLLYFNTEADINKQINKFLTLKRQVFPNEAEFKQQLYIDLRYGDRVFYQ